MTSNQWDTIRHFKPSEFSDPESMSYQLLVRLDSARSLAGIPFKINSSTREGSPSHSTGHAVDISALTSYKRFLIVSSLIKVGFTRIGAYTHHVHVDDAPGLFSPSFWVGTSS